MKLSYYFLFLLSAGLVSCQSSQSPSTQQWEYPATQTVEHVDTYFGHEVADPYRWLEDDNADETAAWVQAQNELTFSHLEQISFRDALKQRLEELEDYEKISAPFREGDYYYFYRNDGLQNQSVLYRKPDLDGEADIFLDPNTFSKDGTVSLAGSSFSGDGSYFAYAISISGSDWREIYVKNTQTGEELSDKIEWAKFTSIAWQGEGFYYQRFPKPEAGEEMKSENTHGKIYYHKLGSSQSEDQLIFEAPDQPRKRFSAQVTDDERFLILYAQINTSGNEMYLKDLRRPDSEFVAVVSHDKNNHRVLGNDGNRLFIRTDLDAPNGRIVVVEATRPQVENWTDLIPENEHVLQASLAGPYLFANYLIDAKTKVFQYHLDGKQVREVPLPGIGSAFGFSGKSGDTELFYRFSSFTVPTAIYHYDLASGEAKLYQQAQVAFNPDDFTTEQVFFNSKDGTRIPMFIVYKKGLEKNGKNPTWLYSYGGFNVSLRPGFRASNIAWLENGGVYAQPNIRGGGEYGEKWHEAGTKMQKQNVFDDFIAAGEYLIENGYTSSEFLAVAGGSNGGLLVGATINQRPDLARVAFPMVGVMDMLRYQQFTIGRAWSYDYGTAEDSEEMFQYLKAYSPLHNIDPNATYPATLVMTADHDDRVVPAHSFKYAATLQAKAGHGPNPLLIRIETKAGHGGGTPTSKRIEQWADRYAFAFYHMGKVPVHAMERNTDGAL